MANKIKVGYEINDNGSVDKLKKKTDAAANSTENLNNKKNKYNRQEKGAAGITSNSTKAFAKQAQSINGGLVPAYATLAANVFAVTAAFGVLQRAAAVQQLESGLMAVGRAAGANLKLVSESLRQVTDLAVSTQAAMEATAIATSAGFSEQQILSLGEVAKGASLALGRDMTDAMTRLVRGTSKLEPELLDELGIFVKLGVATEKYADSLGKPVTQLTEFERRQAFANAAIEEGTRKFGRLNELVDANPYDKLAASFNDLTKIGLNFANSVLTPIVSFLAETPVALLGFFGVFASGIVSQITPSIQASAEIAKRKSEELAYRSSKASKVVSKDYTKAAKNVQNSWGTVPKSVAALEQKFKNGTYSANELKVAIQRLSSSEKLRAKAAISSNKQLAAEREMELAQVTNLKLAMMDLQKAEKKRFTASAKGISADRGSTSTALTARGLQQMDRSTSLMQKFSIATRYSGLQLQNLNTKHMQGAKGLARLSVGFRAAAGSARLFGSALLSAIPVIGQIIMIGSIAYEAFKWMFEKKPTLLDKELEKANERYAEFPNIVAQMATAYASAATRAQAFAEAMRPGVGLLKQTKDQINAIIMAEKGAATAKVVQAQKEKIQADMAVARAEALRAEAEQGKSMDWEEGPSNEQLAVEKALLELKNKQAAAAQALQDAKDFQFSQQAVDGIIQGVVELTASTKALQSQTVKGSSEWEEYERRLKGTQGVLDLLSSNDVDGAVKALEKLNNKAVANQNAFDSSSETIVKFTNAMAASKKVTGEFASTIDMLNEAVNKIASATAPETIARYTDVFDQFNIAYADTVKGKTKDSLFTPEEIKSLNAAAKELEAYTSRLETYNATIKVKGLIDAGIAETASIQAQAGQKGNSLLTEQLKLKHDTILAQEKLSLLLKNNARTEEETNAAILALLKAQTAERLKQEQIRQQNVADVTRTQGQDMGAMVNSTSMLARDKDQITGFNSASIQTLSQGIDPLLKNLAKLGPEGELIQAIGESAFNMAEVFTSAFEKMGDGPIKLADGLQMAASVVSSLGAIQAAQGKAAVAAIDKQIDAEKKRDGKSKESLAKIAAMEKKKEQQERKNFEREKKTKMASAIISTALGMTRAFELGPILGPVMAGVIAAMGAAQISMIAGQSFDGGSGAAPSAPSKISVGNRQNTVDLARSSSPSGELAYARGQSGTGTGMSNYTPAFTGAKYRASGGNTAFVVGEQGPEMFVPDRPGTIVPADETAKGTSQPVNVSFNINAVDNRGVEDLLVNQRGYIIGMIREAANAHGETFLEQVDERAYEMEK